MGEVLKQKYSERDFIKALKKIDLSINDEFIKLSDKNKKLKLSHKLMEKRLAECRNLLIALQSKINVPEFDIIATLKHVNLALGYNQWDHVKDI